MVWITNGYRRSLGAAIRLRWITVAFAAAALGGSAYLLFSGAIGSEFLPHLDEGAIWARATLAPSTGPTEGSRLMNEARVIIAVFRENKEELITAMDRELEKLPGALWNFSQPIADNMEEAVSGVKGELAIKIYGDDLKTLESKE